MIQKTKKKNKIKNKKSNIYFPLATNIFTKNIKNNTILNQKIKAFSNENYLKKVKNSILNNRPDILHNLKLSNDLKKEIIKNSSKMNNLKLKYNSNKSYLTILNNNNNKKSFKNNTNRNKQISQKGGSLLYNINKLSVPLVLWFISKGLEIHKNGAILENKDKNKKSKLIQEAGGLINNLSIKTVPTALWLIGNKLSINEKGFIKKKKYNKLIQSGGSSLFYEINKLAVPILLWFVGYGLEKVNNYSKTFKMNKNTEQENINKLTFNKINLTKSIKKRMTKTVGGGFPFLQPLAETLLIPGLFTLFGILIKKNIDSYTNKDGEVKKLSKESITENI